jgi:hypothetical protein
LPGIAGRDLPIIADTALQAQLDTFAALLAAQQELRGIGWIDNAGIGPIELVDGDRGQEAIDRLPLRADLIVIEPFGLQRLRVGC